MMLFIRTVELEFAEFSNIHEFYEHGISNTMIFVNPMTIYVERRHIS